MAASARFAVWSVISASDAAVSAVSGIGRCIDFAAIKENTITVCAIIWTNEVSAVLIACERVVCWLVSAGTKAKILIFITFQWLADPLDADFIVGAFVSTFAAVGLTELQVNTCIAAFAQFAAVLCTCALALVFVGYSLTSLPAAA